jgi:glycosyltransferase involved in cell wall biosynthesis
VNKLVVVLPAFNEEATVASVIAANPRDVAHFSEIEIIVVDDGSTNATAQGAADAGAVVVSHGHNRGLGAAFRTGVDAALRAGADVAVTIDADGQFNAEDIPLLAGAVARGEAGLASCSRFRDPALTPRMPRSKRWGNRILARVISAIIGERIYDVACGFRAYSRDALLLISTRASYTYTQEVLLDLAYKGVGISEYPLEVRGEREYGRSKVVGSVWRYGYNVAGILLTSIRDYRPLRFFLSAALVVLLMGIGMALFVALHFARTGAFTPYIALLGECDLGGDRHAGRHARSAAFQPRGADHLRAHGLLRR